jgi:hypothetical protein
MRLVKQLGYPFFHFPTIGTMPSVRAAVLLKAILMTT